MVTAVLDEGLELALVISWFSDREEVPARQMSRRLVVEGEAAAGMADC